MQGACADRAAGTGAPRVPQTHLLALAELGLRLLVARLELARTTKVGARRLELSERQLGYAAPEVAFDIIRLQCDGLRGIIDRATCSGLASAGPVGAGLLDTFSCDSVAQTRDHDISRRFAYHNFPASHCRRRDLPGGCD